MKKKGFTLIELLAVIVILAIIALIATPIIMGVIEDAKKNSAKDSAYGYIDGVNNYYARKMLDSTFKLDGRYSIDESGKLNNVDLGVKGTRPVSGSLTYYDNKISKGCLTIDGYKITIKNDKTEKVEKGKCEEKIYKIGEAVYLNPETNSECDVSSAISTTGTKSGCMKWYVYKKNEDGTYQMILDHNTTHQIQWISEEDYIASGGEFDYGGSGRNDKGGVTVIKQLKSDTSLWDKALKPRLITADEVADIVGASSEDTIKWSSAPDGTTMNTQNTWFYLDGGKNSNKTSYSSTDGWQKQYATAKGESEYYWLFDYTGSFGDCMVYGCNITDGSTMGYWTSTPSYNNSAWNVSKHGKLGTYVVRSQGLNFGVRPVITF